MCSRNLLLLTLNCGTTSPWISNQITSSLSAATLCLKGNLKWQINPRATVCKKPEKSSGNISNHILLNPKVGYSHQTPSLSKTCWSRKYKLSLMWHDSDGTALPAINHFFSSRSIPRQITHMQILHVSRSLGRVHCDCSFDMLSITSSFCRKAKKRTWI